MRRSEKALAVLLMRSGVIPLSLALRRARLIVLAYHHIHRDGQPDPQEITNRFYVGMTAFLKQLDYLRGEYRFVRARDVVSILGEGGRLPERSLLLTFDDGYQGFYRDVHPILVERGIPALVNLITGWVDGDLTPWDVLINRAVNTFPGSRLVLELGEREISLPLNSTGARASAFSRLSDIYQSVPARDRIGLLEALRERAPWITRGDGVLESLRWEEVRELAGKGFELGCHTHSHAVLTGMSEVEVGEELAISRGRLAEMAGVDAPVFAYPAGRYDCRVVDWVARAGFPLALSSDDGPVRCGGDLHAIPRVSTRGEDSISDLLFRMSGLRRAMARVCRVGRRKGYSLGTPAG